jgi:hypothetical protein
MLALEKEEIASIIHPHIHTSLARAIFVIYLESK